MKSLVWVYWAGGAASDELRWSMRSAWHCFTDEKIDLILVGDRPPWYCGKFIRCPRVSKQFRQKWVDCVNKLQTIIDSDLVSDQFAWFYDDQQFLKPVSFSELVHPRADKRYTPTPTPHTAWQQIRFATFQELNQHELPTWDYGSHCPHVFKKAELQQVIDDFNLHHRPLLPEILYGNTYFEKPEPLTPFFKMANLPDEVELGPAATIIGHGHGFEPKLREYLAATYHEPSPVES